MTSEERKRVLLDVADALEANVRLINVENEADVSAAQVAGYEKSLISRLALKPGKARDPNLAMLDKCLVTFIFYYYYCLLSFGFCLIMFCTMFSLDPPLFLKTGVPFKLFSEFCLLYLAD